MRFGRAPSSVASSRPARCVADGHGERIGRGDGTAHHLGGELAGLLRRGREAGEVDDSVAGVALEVGLELAGGAFGAGLEGSAVDDAGAGLDAVELGEVGLDGLGELARRLRWLPWWHGATLGAGAGVGVRGGSAAAGSSV